MKPLTEWTTEELIEWLEIDSGTHRRAALAELLRRERGRCAAECLRDVSEVEAESDTAHVASWLRTAADRIRGMQ